MLIMRPMREKGKPGIVESFRSNFYCWSTVWQDREVGLGPQGKVSM